jgi:hypothetical protein
LHGLPLAGLERKTSTRKMTPTTNLDYSDEDLVRYIAMVEEQKQLLAQDKTIFDAPDLWKRFETLRNRYNGNPPKQLLRC